MTFPVVETIQEKNICHFVLTPPRFSVELQNKIKDQAIQIIKAIGGVGVFGVEFFKIGDELIFNEVAPRTHNSGHYSIEACDYSQFDALIKLILDHPITTPKLKTAKQSYKVMRPFTKIHKDFFIYMGKKIQELEEKWDTLPY